MTVITRETESVWIYIKYSDSVEKLLEENGIHYKRVTNIELEEIDEPETLEELEMFKERDSGSLLSFESKITRH